MVEPGRAFRLCFPLIFSAKRRYTISQCGYPSQGCGITGCLFSLIRRSGILNSSWKGGSVMAEVKVGEVVKFFAKPSVAAVKIVAGDLNVGDKVKFTGHTTDFEEVIDSMEINNQKVEKAVAGDYIGIKTSDRVRPGDEMFKVTPD
jgi:hypothetical protein